MATSSVGFDNFFSTTLNGAISDSDLTITLNAVPTPSEGFLVIEPDNASKREIIYYTSKGASTVTCPSGAGNGRGYDGTTATSHSDGVTVIMAPVAAMWEALQDGTGLASGFKIGTTDAVVTADITDGAITPDKLGLSPQTDFVSTAETETNTSYDDMTTSGPAVTVTVPDSGIVLVLWQARIENTTANASSYMGVAASGANTVAASDSYSAINQTAVAAQDYNVHASHRLYTGLTAGSTTFTCKYRVTSGTATFSSRSITAIPLA